jgi:hypothetical protein
LRKKYILWVSVCQIEPRELENNFQRKENPTVAYIWETFRIVPQENQNPF